jgi:hypothetical protein
MLACLLAGCPGAIVLGDDNSEVLSCRVTRIVGREILVDAGSREGLGVGQRGRIVAEGETIDTRDPGAIREGIHLGDVEVVSVTERTARLRLTSRAGSRRPDSGDWALLTVVASNEQTESNPGEFVPLLTQPPPRGVEISKSSNVHHGRLWLRQDLQVDSESDLDFYVTRTGTSGSVERLAGTPWSLEWRGQASYRSGDAFDGTDFENDVRLDLYRLNLYRRYDEGEFVRLGRFLPLELTSVGYVDGVQGEVPLTDVLRAGAILGLKPDRDDLDFSVDEPTAVAYMTVEAGERGEFYYSGTGGLLFSLFEGEADRLAFLVEQRADLGPRLSLFSTSTVDFDIGGAEFRDGVSLSHVDLYASYKVTSFLRARAGVDHYERPDTRVERDLLGIVDERLFDDGFWRYWVGGSQQLPLSLHVDEEVALIDSPGTETALHWRVSITRTGLPFLRSGQITATVYNLEGFDIEGHGFLISSYLPFAEGAVAVSPSIGFRLLETDETSEEFDATDASVYVYWYLTESVSLNAGANLSLGDSVERTFLSVGLDYRW